jgi:hypothetical protein
MTGTPTKADHLRWAIQSRARNQNSSLNLLELFDAFPLRWATKRYSRAAQDLVAVAFSLWRAAFLADKASQRGEVFKAGRSFLEKVIEDNAIGFTQDRTSKAWTFNYYTRNARSSLEHLHVMFPNNMPKYDTKPKRSVTQRWDYCQDIFDQAVLSFRKSFEQDISLKKRKRDKQARSAIRNRQRKIVRQLTRTSKQLAP